jgi:DNA polymerase-3 subunit beta
MDVTIEREALLRILARSQGVVDKRHSMAVLTNALLEADGKSLSLVATDLEVSLKQTVDAKVKTPGTAAVSARTLFEIVRESTTDTVRLRSLENQWLRVSYGKSEFKLMGIDPAEYPGMPKPGSDGADPTSIDLAPGDFTDMIRKTVFSVSTDDTRSNLAGIFLTKGEKKGTLRMVATDGHRLAMIDRPVSTSLPEGVILPRKGLAEVGKLLGEESDKVTLSISSSEASVTVGDTLLSMRLVEGKFPDYKKVVPEEVTKIVKADRDALLHTLKRISILSSERARGVRFALAESVLEISANNPDMGEASEEIPVAYDGPKLEVGFNARYLIDVLSVLPEGSEVTLGLGDELSPGLVSGNDASYTYVVMPLRI